ncbi:hypothetical protein, partial [Mucilaginibacter sp.]|uniref:hypothetical protein n=1 Tax=Mucilaginibacter sp. TaxID=1882438 RepID=UPI0026254F43
MVQISGTYNKGTTNLDQIVAVDKPVKVIVMFDEGDITVEGEKLSINDFSFLKSRELLKDVKGDLSDAV